MLSDRTSLKARSLELEKPLLDRGHEVVSGWIRLVDPAIEYRDLPATTPALTGWLPVTFKIK
jgi:hypothetical protein